jgi:hypothetical protein
MASSRVSTVLALEIASVGTCGLSKTGSGDPTFVFNRLGGSLFGMMFDL